MTRIVAGLTALLLFISSSPPGVALTSQRRAVLINHIAGAPNNLALDGHATGNASAATVNATLTTTHTNDVIVAFVVQNGCSAGTLAVSGGGLTWSLRSGILNTANLQEFSAVAASTLSSATITASCTSGSFLTISVFGISGAKTASPFDPNGSLPNATSGANPSISTTNTNTIALGAFRCSLNTGTAGSGYNLIDQFQFLVTEYKTLTTPQSSLAVTLGSGCTSNGAIGDALTQ